MDQYPFATVYDQEASFYSFQQEQMSNPQWYERFNTRVDVAEAIGVTRQHKVLLEYVAQEIHQQDFTSLSAKDQQGVRTDAQERYIAYAFLRQSGAQHAQLKTDGLPCQTLRLSYSVKYSCLVDYLVKVRLGS
jgi:hypothetical protein